MSDTDPGRGGAVAGFQHPDAVEVPAVVVPADTGLLKPFAEVERFGGRILGLDHEHHVAQGNSGIERPQQARANAAALRSGIDADVDDPSLSAVAVSDGAADDFAVLACYEEADEGKTPEQQQRRKAVGQARFERAFLQRGDIAQLKKSDTADFDAFRPNGRHRMRS